MRQKPKQNPKQDLNSHRGGNRENDFSTLKLAKEIERKKRLKSIKVDRNTTILVPVGVSQAEAVESFRRRQNWYL